jgi:predicted ArsR family transcriptional regulator
MALRTETSDGAILELLGRAGSMRIPELARATQVTPTAVRQRLSRMMAQGLIQRQTSPASRGRPSHTYSLTDLGRREAGHNFVDLALVLWQEVRAISDVEVRRGLLARIAKQMAGLYADRVGGATVGERMRAVADIFTQRSVPFIVENTGGDAAGQLPVLTALACPYPQLAEQDRGICALERMMIAELLEQNVKLSACRLDGDSCCRFQTN